MSLETLHRFYGSFHDLNQALGSDLSIISLSSRCHRKMSIPRLTNLVKTKAMTAIQYVKHEF